MSKEFMQIEIDKLDGVDKGWLVCWYRSCLWVLFMQIK